MLRFFVFFVWFVGLGTRLVADEEPVQKSFSNAVVAVSCDELQWARIGHALGFGASLGVPRDQLLRQVPESIVAKLDSRILEALLAGSDSIPLWIDCLNDDRPTGIHENDAFSGKSSERSQRITCREAAATVLKFMIPSQMIANASGDDQNATLISAAEAWRTQTSGLSTNERIRAWFNVATGKRDSFFLNGFIYQVGHSAAYPVLEEQFLQQASKPDDMLFLNVSAYFRHRRSGAEPFRQKFLKTLPKDFRLEGPDDTNQFFLSMWERLTRYATIDDAIVAWKDRELSTQELEDLVTRSVDMPWAYHSRPVEPVEVHIPVMEANIVGLIREAMVVTDARMRVELLQVGCSAAESLNEIRQHAQFLDPPDSRPLAISWRETTDRLIQLLKDEHEVQLPDRHTTTPAGKAAQLTLKLWGPGSAFAPMLPDGNRDWRTNSTILVMSQPNAVLIPFANEILKGGDYLTAEEYPQEEARKTFETVFQGTAVDMRRALAALSWRSRLLAITEFQYQDSSKLLSQMLVFVERIDIGDPAPGFEVVWENIKGKSIDVTSWTIMRDWLASESRQGRRWRIRGQVSIDQPGFTIVVGPSDIDPMKSVPDIQTSISLYSQSERFRVLPESLERVPRDSWPEIRQLSLDRPEFKDFLQDAPFPVDTLTELNSSRPSNVLHGSDLHFEMGVGIESLDRIGQFR